MAMQIIGVSAKNVYYDPLAILYEKDHCFTKRNVLHLGQLYYCKLHYLKQAGVTDTKHVV
jgi:hypothetical protein